MKCPICQEPSTKNCSACKNVAYCSAEHQKLDWKNHKKVCQPFSIKEVEGMGMGWVATRDLKAGVCLLEEDAAVSTPRWWTKKGPCSNCTNPVCDGQCQVEPAFNIPPEWQDCLTVQKVNSTQDGYVNVMAAWGAAHELMEWGEDLNSKKLKQFMALQDFYDHPSLNQKLQDSSLPVGLFEMVQHPDSLNRDQFRKFLRICQVNDMNRHEPLCPCEPEAEIKCLVYLKASRMNHSCLPNCTANKTPHPNRKRIVTTLPVAKGEQLTLNYYEVLGFEPTLVRQKAFGRNGFICKCKRCLDPTELGTFLSGIKCFNCSSSLSADSDPDGNTVGYFLPADPLDIDSQDPEFECHRCHFKHSFAKIMAKLPKVVRNAFSDLKQLDCIDEKNLESLLNKYEADPAVKAHLHKNHWLLQGATRIVVREQVFDTVDTLPKQELEKLLRRMESLLMIDDKLFPSIFYQARLDHSIWLSSVVEWLSQRFGGQMDRQQHIKVLQTGVKADEEQSECYKVDLPHVTAKEKLEVSKALKRAEDRKKRLAALLNASK